MTSALPPARTRLSADAPDRDDTGTPAKEDARRRSSLTVLRALLPFLAPYRWQILFAAIALVAGAGLLLGFGRALRFVIDDGFAAGDLSALTGYMGWIGAGIVLMSVITFTRFYLVTWVGERFVADIRSALFKHLLTLSPGFYESTKIGEIQSRLTTDTTLIQTVIGSSASFALRQLLTLTGGTVMLFITSPVMTAAVFAAIPVILLPMMFFGRRVRRLSKDSQDRVADISAETDEALGAIRTVQAFTQEPEVAAQFDRSVESAFRTAQRRILSRAFLSSSVILLAFGGLMCLVWFGGRAVMTGDLSAGVLAEFGFYAVLVAGGLAGLSEVFGELQRAAGATERLVELMNVEPEIMAKGTTTAADPQAPLLAFDSVRFNYPSKPDAPALRDLSFSVHEGETVAIVGPSGAGKSTLFQLLLRFYDPQGGAIRVKGADIAGLTPADLRRHFSWVGQEPVLFSTTAAQNIAFGAPHATEEAIRMAAREAEADIFLNALPEGYDSYLGEKGVRLSGGQRQRLAIARALLSGADILLLDEATSALDAQSEVAVQRALERLMAGRTTLVIAHRLATVKKADRILVMDDGRIVEEGRHDQLVAKGGLYASLAALQFTEGE